jgi:hypothetical protein
VPFVIAGNKTDLADDAATSKGTILEPEEKVPEWGDGLLLAAEVGAVRFRTFSALNQGDLSDVFEAVIEAGLCKPIERVQDKKNCSLQ